MLLSIIYTTMMVELEKGEMKGLFALCGFYTELTEALKIKVDVLTTGSLDDEFLEEIKNAEVILYAA